MYCQHKGTLLDPIIIDEGLLGDSIGGNEYLNDTVLHLQGLKEILTENEKLKDEVHIVMKTCLMSYYELSKAQHRLLNNDAEYEERINEKIDESLLELKEIQLSALSVNLMSTMNNPLQQTGTPRELLNRTMKFEKNYLQRYQEILAEARETFLSDLSQFQKELHNARFIINALTKEK